MINKRVREGSLGFFVLFVCLFSFYGKKINMTYEFKCEKNSSINYIFTVGFMCHLVDSADVC